MTIYLLKKEKNRIYKSEKIVEGVFGKRLVHDEDGAPYLIGVNNEIITDKHISITDTKNFWACSFSEKTVGIDMEEMCRTVTTSVVRRLHPKEREYLSVLSEGSLEWKEEFLTIWTKKESYSKYAGKGLALGFTRFCVLPEFEDCLGIHLFSKKIDKLIVSATEDFEIEEILYEAPHNKSALEAGADILDMIGCSAGQLKKKLIDRGYSEDESQQAVDTLSERGYLNDRSYASSLAEKFAKKGYSSRKIEAELRQKAIDNELAREISEKFKSDYYENDEFEDQKESDKERALRIAQKTLGNSARDDKTKAKIARKLASFGYDTSIIYDTIDKLFR